MSKAESTTMPCALTERWSSWSFSLLLLFVFLICIGIWLIYNVVLVSDV